MPPDAREERPVARSPMKRPSRVKNETITLRQVRRRGCARGRGKILQGERAMATLYHFLPILPTVAVGKFAFRKSHDGLREVGVAE